MANYFDKNGNPISEEKWRELREEKDYALVNYTFIREAVKPVEIVTYWKGLVSHYGPTGPMIFESRVKDEDTVYFHHYATLEEAKRAHALLVYTHTDEAISLSRWTQIAEDL